jgi:hypothetical protein
MKAIGKQKKSCFVRSHASDLPVAFQRLFRPASRFVDDTHTHIVIIIIIIISHNTLSDCVGGVWMVAQRHRCRCACRDLCAHAERHRNLESRASNCKAKTPDFFPFFLFLLLNLSSFFLSSFSLSLSDVHCRRSSVAVGRVAV